jgi:hypothetical protein
MIPAEIQNLIDKFYAGETTEQEEQQLKSFLDQDDLPQEFASDKVYFLAMQSASVEELDDSFDDKLFAKIEQKQPVKTRKIWNFSLSGAAAAILIFLAVWFGTDLLRPTHVYGTIEDPQVAFAETKKVLDEVSKKLNKGIEPVKKTVDKVETNIKKTSEIKKINESLHKTKSIQKIDEASELLKSFSKVYVNYGKS